MKEKRVILTLLLTITLIIALVALVSSQDTQASSKGYSCLKERMGNNCGDTRNTQENVFNLLAMAYDSSNKDDCKKSLIDKESESCFGPTEAAVCDTKSTALAVIGLSHIDADVDKYIEWMESNTRAVKELTWFLQVDADNLTNCDINGRSFKIGEDKRIVGSNPDGLSRAYNGYWFRINDVEKNYTISCDLDFKSNLIYQKPKSTTFYVSSETYYASPGDSFTQTIVAKCFTRGNVCDYESTLWGSLALAKEGVSIAPYVPYLTSMSDDPANRKFLPSAFLYMIFHDPEYYTDLVTSQKQNKFWDVSGNQLYDTGIALWALQDNNYDEATNARDYVVSIQGPQGCWSSYTSLLLYAIWPKSSSDSGSSSSTKFCSGENFGCVSAGQCSGSDLLSGYDCPSEFDVCCAEIEEEPTCSEIGGEVCTGGKECSGYVDPDVSDVSYPQECCVGRCNEVVVENECEEEHYYDCREECSDDETHMSSYDAGCTPNICCAPPEDDDPIDTPKKSYTWLIILLIALIILIVVAIIFRDRIKFALFKKKDKSRKGPPGSDIQSRRPPMPPPGMNRRISHTPRRIVPRGSMNRRPMVRGPSRDKDFNDTMKKLRDMSK